MKTTEKTPINPSNVLETLRETMRSNLELSTQQKDAANHPSTYSFYGGCEYAYQMAILYIDLEMKLTESPNNTTEK